MNHYRLWAIGSGALWLPQTVSCLDVAECVNQRERWEEVQFYGRLRYGLWWDIMRQN